MNIIKLQNMLRGVADEALIGYVQNPQGEVPSYLALSELQRRKDTRAKYQAEQAPESSVAEDLGQEAIPNQGGLAMLAGQPQMQMEDQGLAGLPVDDDMYQEDSFAAGGIVAFQKGGYSYSPDYDPVEQYRRARQLGESNLMAKRYNMPTTSVTSAGIETPFDASLSYYQDLRDKAAMSGKGLTDLTSTVNTLQKRREAWLAGSLDPYSQTSPVGSKPNMEGLQKPVVSTNKPSTEPPPLPTPPTSPVVNPYAVDSLTPRPLSVEEAMKRQEEAMKLAGVDPNFYKTQAADLLAQREALKADRSEAGNMALIRAGLATMGGTSPFALVNLGKGAEAGTEQYMQDARNIRAENRLLAQADLKLKEAQNAQQRGDAQGALKAIQERETIIANYNHYKMTTGATLKAAEIAAGARTGSVRLPALFNALNKSIDPKEKAQIQAEIDRIVAIEGGGDSAAVPQDILDILKKHPGTSKK